MNERGSGFKALRFTLIASFALLGQAAYADTRETCEEMIGAMGFKLEPYIHEPAGFFSNETHRFGAVTCHVSRDGTIKKIERGNEILAEDGIFGKSAIHLRDEAKTRYAVISAEARASRDSKIQEAKRQYNKVRQTQQDKYDDIEILARDHLDSIISGLKRAELKRDAIAHLNISDSIVRKVTEDELFIYLKLRADEQAADRRLQLEEKQRIESETLKIEEETRLAAQKAEKAVTEDIMSMDWAKDVHLSSSHLSVGVFSGEKRWDSPSIGRWVCTVAERHDLNITWVRFFDVIALQQYGLRWGKIEIHKLRC